MHLGNLLLIGKYAIHYHTHHSGSLELKRLKGEN